MFELGAGGVGVRNASAARSIDEVSVRARDNPFVHCTISIAHSVPGARFARNPVIFETASLPPGSEEFVELFGLGGSDVYSEQDLLSKKQTFQLEARGRDSQTLVAVLEYDPSSRPPTIRRVA